MTNVEAASQNVHKLATEANQLRVTMGHRLKELRDAETAVASAREAYQTAAPAYQLARGRWACAAIDMLPALEDDSQ